MFPTKENPLIIEQQQPADIQSVLERTDPEILQKKIIEFQKMNISQMSDLEIDQAIREVLYREGTFSCYINMRNYPAGTKFFRVKELKGTNIPNVRFSEYQDYWETSSQHIKKYGRLNKPGESLLYVSPDLRCAIGEVHIKENTPFVAIQYTAKSEVKVNLIGGEFDYEQMGVTDEKVQLIHEMYNTFLRDEFSKYVEEGTEYLYKVSEKIAKQHFDLTPRIVQDAWAYSSVQNKSKYNVCFRPEIAHSILEFNGAMICILNGAKEICVKCIACGVNPEGKILFYPMGSTVQKQIFPEIVHNQEFNI